MTTKMAVFAPDDICTRYGVVKSIGEDGKVLCAFKDWSFTSFHSTIVDSSQLDSIQEDIISGVDREYQLHIPPVVFDNDVMKLSTGGFTLEFKAKEALRAWALKHATLNNVLQVLEVPYAVEWKKKSLFAQGKAPVIEIGQIAGDDEQQVESEEVSSLSADNDESVFTKALENLDTTKKAWDWTYSSDYCGSISNNGVFNESLTLSGLVKEGKESVKCFPCVESGINYNMLRNRIDPILFYDEMVLYQDDLEDCGEVVFDVKLRVMPSCWFILSRMFLRVDYVTIRLIESRHFHQFGAKEVYLEVIQKECQLGEATSTGEGTTTAGLPHVNIPIAVQRDVNALSQMLPIRSQSYYKFQVYN